MLVKFKIGYIIMPNGHVWETFACPSTDLAFDKKLALALKRWTDSDIKAESGYVEVEREINTAQ